jgi:Domain of unknown function (DUF5658)
LNHLLVQFAYLQLLDLMTTLAFLVHGIREGNPLVRFLIDRSSNPISALVAVKMMAVLLGLYCWRMGRLRVLTRMNLLFAVVVAWNLVALIVGSIRTA